MTKIYMKAKSTKSEVEIIVKNVYSQVVGLQDNDTLRALDQQLSYYVSGYQFTKAYKTGWWDDRKKKWDRWDGRNHLLTKNCKFLTGLLGRVESVLKNHNISYKITDQRKEIPFKSKIKTKNIEEREYQKRVLDATLKHSG